MEENRKKNIKKPAAEVTLRAAGFYFGLPRSVMGAEDHVSPPPRPIARSSGCRGCRCGGVGVNAVDGDHDCQGRHGVAFPGNLQKIGIAPGEPLFADAGNCFISADHLVLMLQKISVDLPVPTLCLQSVTRAQKR